MGALCQSRELGLIGGMSWHSTALYYERINRTYEARLGQHHSFRGQIANLDFSRLLSAASSGQWSEVERHISEAARRLADSGCEVIALTAITAHRFYDAVAAAGQVVVPHAIAALAARLRTIGSRRVGLIGTAITCGSDFVRSHLGQDHRAVLVLDDGLQREIDDIIRNALTSGGDLRSGRLVLRRAVEQLEAQGADVVALACTELPLLLPMDDLSTPLLDLVQLHVDEICNATLSASDAA